MNSTCELNWSYPTQGHCLCASSIYFGLHPDNPSLLRDWLPMVSIHDLPMITEEDRV